MALSGTIKKDFYNPYGVYGYSLILEWTGSQSIPNNTTTITANLYLQSNGADYAISSSANKTAKIIIDGTTYTKTTANVSVSDNQKKLIYTASKVVSHNADGTKNISLGGSLEINIQLSGGWVGVITLSNKSFTLNTIPRASTITSFPNFTIGDSIPVTISRASSSFTHTLELKAGSLSVAKRTGIGTSTTIALTDAELDSLYYYLRAQTKWTMYLYCTTYSGSTQIGSRTYKTATAYVGSNIVPTFETITHSEYVSNVNTIVGKYVQGLSRLNLAITGAVGAKYSTIKSYQITFEGTAYNASTATSEVIGSSGDITITGKVTDSRGRVCVKTVTITVLAYAPPKITAFALQRCNSDGTPNMVGEYVKVAREGSVSSLVNVTEKNSLTYRIKSKDRGATTWVTKKTATIGGLSLTGSDILGTYAAVTSFDFRLEISDQFNTTLALNVLPTGKVTLSWHKDGIGVGKVREQGSLDAADDIYVKNKKVVYFGDYETW